MAKTTSPPATAPTTIAVAGFRKAAAALLATNPAIHPFAVSDASGLPNRTRVTTAAVRHEAAAESVVLMTISTTLAASTPANRIALAEFNAIHPAQASTQPVRASTALCPGIAAGMPSFENFPWRGPKIHVMDNAVSPPTT